jgi:hypothetical protein
MHTYIHTYIDSPTDEFMRPAAVEVYIYIDHTYIHTYIHLTRDEFLRKFAPPSLLEGIRTREAIRNAKQRRSNAPRATRNSAALGLLNELSGTGAVSVVRCVCVCIYIYIYVCVCVCVCVGMILFE